MLAEYAADIRDGRGQPRSGWSPPAPPGTPSNAADFTSWRAAHPRHRARGHQRRRGGPAVVRGCDRRAGRGRRWTSQQPEPPYLVVDIGGGSTEFVLGGTPDGAQAGADLAAISVDIGCVRLTERHLHCRSADCGARSDAATRRHRPRAGRRGGGHRGPGRPHPGRAGRIGDHRDRHRAWPAALRPGAHASRADLGRVGARGHGAAAEPDHEQRAAIGPCIRAGST